MWLYFNFRVFIFIEMTQEKAWKCFVLVSLLEGCDFFFIIFFFFLCGFEMASLILIFFFFLSFY